MFTRFHKFGTYSRPADLQHNTAPRKVEYKSNVFARSLKVRRFAYKINKWNKIHVDLLL